MIKRVLLPLLLAGTALAQEPRHPFDAAQEAHQKALREFQTAETSFLAAVEIIPDKARRKEILRAHTRRKKAWKTVTAADATIAVAGSPLPDSSTSSTLASVWTEVEHLKQLSRQLKKEAGWLTTNWKNAAASTRSR
mgnify:CR=1 FL=1